MKFTQIDDDSRGNKRFQIGGTLISKLSEKIFENSNGKKYRLATIQYPNRDGIIKQATVSVYEGNYNRADAVFAIGNEYLCTVTIVTGNDGNPVAFIQMSHLLAGSGTADVNDFLAEAEVNAEAFTGTGSVTN